MKRLYSILSILLLCAAAHAQPYETNPDFNRTRNWHFGHGVGLRFDPDTIYEVPTSMLSDEAAAVHTDTDGNLLLYSNGEKIWNANHEVIHNGDLVLGHNSSGMGSVFVCHEDNPDSIYLFNTFWNLSTTKEFSVNLIVKEADTFRIAYKDSVLRYRVCEPIAVVKADNGKDVWVTVHEFGANNLYSYLITSTGIVYCPILSKSKISPAGSPNAAAFDIIFSPNGQFMIRSITNLPPPIINTVVEIYEFNNSNGSFDFLYSLDSFNRPFTGLAFSKDNSKIFVVERDSGLNIFEFYKTDSLSTAISRKIVNTNGSKFQIQNTPYDNSLVWTINESSYITIINTDSTEPLIDSVKLHIGLAKFDLPNFNQSYYYTPSINFAIRLNCVLNSIQLYGQDTFNANTHNWEISKQGSTPMTSNIKNPLIAFDDTGVYSVRYIVSNGSRSDTLTKEVTILPKIEKGFLGNDTGWCNSIVNPITINAPDNMHCYEWNNGSNSSLINVSDTGTYWVKMTTPNFCVIYDTIKVDILSPPSVSNNFLGADKQWCKNADTIVMLEAPTGYSYLWNTGDTTPAILTNEAGLYYVDVFEVNGCSVRDSLKINHDSIPNIASNFLGNNINWCANIDTIVTLKAPLGYKYSWSTEDTTQNISTNQAGTYWANVIGENDCFVSDTITISLDSIPDISPNFLGSDRSWCANLDTSVLLFAPSGYKYLWSTADTSQTIEVSHEGTYWVNVIGENACFVSDTIAIIHLALPSKPTLNRTDDSLFSDADDNLQISCYWNFNKINDSTKYLILQDTGIYFQKVTNSNQCVNFSDTMLIAHLGVSVIQNDFIKVFPNPSYGTLYISSQQENFRYEIKDITGKVLARGKLNKGDNQLEIYHIAHGNYILHVFNEIYNYNIKLIKQSP